ncbi:LysR family transcriptional regulator [Streptomyces sp. NPDC004752]
MVVASKAIRRVESRLGVQLLVRSSRHVSLTPAGEALLHHGRHALDAMSAVVTGCSWSCSPTGPG